LKRHSGRPRRSSGARSRSCGQRTRTWSARRYGRIRRCTTCLTAIITRLAGQQRTGPDRISFVKVLKHVRRSVIRQSVQTSVQIKQVMAMMAAKVRRKLDNGVRRPREADRVLKRPDSKYSYRGPNQQRGRGPTRQVPVKIITLHQVIVQ
jgi:hypothetical protein